MENKLKFHNRFIESLPGDSDTTNIPRQVYEACYSKVTPRQTSNPQLVAYSIEMANSLGLTAEDCESPEFAQVFSGNHLLPGMQSYASCYGGHQFGGWAGQLGDGRAINLGEVVYNDQYWTLQLKGAGRTPYSRSADGLAVFRSSVREFLCSEAMYHLGIPTTRALSLILTGDLVTRDMFYNGNPQLEPGAVVCRVAPSFTRFGNFEIFTSRSDLTRLKQLLDYTITYDFPHLGQPSVATYIQWFEEVCKNTAHLIAQWMRVGFVHGVMNTDNMSILGLTIDYGPYGWLDAYDPDWTPNTTDAQGKRYRFENQSHIAKWNLIQLANAIYPLVNKAEPLKEAVSQYVEIYQEALQEVMRKKLGFKHFISATDNILIEELLSLLTVTETDMTIFYRQLAAIEIEAQKADLLSDEQLLSPLIEAYYTQDIIKDPAYQAQMGTWLRRYIQRLQDDALDYQRHQQIMHNANPKYILRNYLAQEAIDLAEQQGDFSRIHTLLEMIKNPYAEQEDKAQFFQKRPEWARKKPGCSMLSCSS